MTEHIRKFYAVTNTSIYQVLETGDYQATATKIRLRGESRVPLGYELCKGGMIAICNVLQAYMPEKYGMSHQLTGYEREIEKVNTGYWGAHSSNIVALFKDETSAHGCLETEDLLPCDARWWDSTKQVLKEIGKDHPSFYIARHPGLRLLAA